MFISCEDILPLYFIRSFKRGSRLNYFECNLTLSHELLIINIQPFVTLKGIALRCKSINRKYHGNSERQDGARFVTHILSFYIINNEVQKFRNTQPPIS